MTRSFTLLALISNLFIFPSCFLFNKKSIPDEPQVVGNWVRRAEFDGTARNEAVSFTVGDSAYIATGYDGTKRLNDLWRYDADHNYWVQKASLPSAAARNSAVGFSTSAKGYITTGFNGVTRLKDTWEYDPVKNSWTQKADFAGSARTDAVGFGINDKGYVATGNDGNDLKDIWTYDPAADTWLQKTSFTGSPREGAVAFVYKNQAYIVTGINNGVLVNDLQMYDQATDKWTEKRSITNVSTATYDDNYGTTLIVRSNAACFIMGDRAYLCTGENGSILKTVWEYNFAVDAWIEKTPYEGIETTGAVGFTVKGRGFLAGGRNTKYIFDDLREFFPFNSYNAND